MGSNPRDFGNLAEVLELEPRDALDNQTQSQHSDLSPSAIGAGALQERLAEQLRSWNEQAAEPVRAPLPEQEISADGAEPAETERGTSRKTIAWRVVKTLVTLAAVISLGWTPLQRFLQTTSAEATVNARLVTLRAPIDGKVSMTANAAGVGTTIDAGAPLLNIEDQRADRTQLDTLRRQISGLESEREALARRKTQLEGLQGHCVSSVTLSRTDASSSLRRASPS